MIYVVYLPLLVSLLLAVISPLLARRLAPGRAGVALVAAAAMAAASSTWVLLLLGATVLPDTPVVAEHAAAEGAHFIDPVPDGVGALAVAALAVGGYRAVVVLRRRRAGTRALRALCAACRCPAAEAHAGGGAAGGSGGELVMVPLDDPHACAVPGRWGRGGQIVLTRGMARVLGAPQRRVVLAHEQAHLAQHHHGQATAVELAAALNPLLGPTRDAVRYLVERDADEYAATEVGDRGLAARALAIAALAGTGPGLAGTGLASTRGDGALGYERLGVGRRVAALQAAPLPERRLGPAMVLVLGSLTALAAADATWAFARLVHAALPGW